jgi:hypothetical protein
MGLEKERNEKNIKGRVHEMEGSNRDMGAEGIFQLCTVLPLAPTLYLVAAQITGANQDLWGCSAVQATTQNNMGHEI